MVNNTHNGLPEWPKKLALLALQQLEKRMSLQHIKSRYYWDDEDNPTCAQVIVEMMQIVTQKLADEEDQKKQKCAKAKLTEGEKEIILDAIEEKEVDLNEIEAELAISASR